MLAFQKTYATVCLHTLGTSMKDAAQGSYYSVAKNGTFWAVVLSAKQSDMHVWLHSLQGLQLPVRLDYA